MHGTVLFTAAHIGDLERFALQRESYERCGISIPHVAIIDHEDLSRFHDLPFQKNLTLISSREILSRATEARRRVYRLRRRQPEWWQCRRFGKGIHGWGVQQIMKLASPRVTDAKAIVSTDCDTIFVGRVSAADFYHTDGRVHLYETQDDVDAEMAGWLSASMRFLGVPCTAKPIQRYTHSPVVFHRSVLLNLQRFTEKQHLQDWENAFLETSNITEYTTYGVYARHLDGLKHVSPTTPAMSCTFWFKDEVEGLEAKIVDRVRQQDAKILAVQSNTGVRLEDYREQLESLWGSLPHERPV